MFDIHENSDDFAGQASMHAALDELLADMGLNFRDHETISSTDIVLACSKIKKLENIILRHIPTDDEMQHQKYIYGNDKEIEILNQIIHAMEIDTPIIRDIYSDLQTFKQTHNIENSPLFFRCIVAVFETWYASEVPPPTPPDSPSPESESEPASRSNSLGRERWQPRPQTSRGRHSPKTHARTSNPPRPRTAPHSRSRSPASRSSSYSEWSLGPDSSSGSRSASRHPSDKHHAHLSDLLHQLSMM